VFCRVAAQRFPAIKRGCRSVGLAEALLKYVHEFELWYRKAKIDVSLKKPISNPPPEPEFRGGITKLLETTVEIVGQDVEFSLYKIYRPRQEDMSFGNTATQIHTVVSIIRKNYNQIETSTELAESYRKLTRDILATSKKLELMRNSLAGGSFVPYGQKAWEIQRVLLPGLRKLRRFLSELSVRQKAESDDAKLNLKAVLSEVKRRYQIAIDNLDQVLLGFDDDRKAARKNLRALNQEAEGYNAKIEALRSEIRWLNEKLKILKERRVSKNRELDYSKKRASEYSRSYSAKHSYVRENKYHCGGNAGHKNPFSRDGGGYVCNTGKSKNYRSETSKIRRNSRKWQQSAESILKVVKQLTVEISEMTRRVSGERETKGEMEAARQKVGLTAKEEFGSLFPSDNETSALVERAKFVSALRSIELEEI